MRAFEIEPDDLRLVRLYEVEPLLPARARVLYEYTVPDLTQRALRELTYALGATSGVYTGHKGSSGNAWSLDERYLEPLAAAKQIASLYLHVLDPLRYATTGAALPTREEIFNGFARPLAGTRLLPSVELLAEHIQHVRELDRYQPGLGTNVARWMQYLAYEALETSVTRRGFTPGRELDRLRSALRSLRDSATVLDRYQALARRAHH